MKEELRIERFIGGVSVMQVEVLSSKNGKKLIKP